MPTYLIQFGYTPQAWASLAKTPEDRSVAVGKLIEAAGGRMLGFYYAFGEFDGAILVEGTDDVTTAACVITALSPGHIARMHTTKLFTAAEGMEIMRKAGSMMFRGPQ
ncbi:MAG: GYD domain-containing protein [Anaerolineae bacterium]